jgi:hypothetical protein
MNVKDIVREWLIAHGYTGLYCSWEQDCGCSLDDLAPCDESFGACLPGYWVACTCEEHDGEHIQTDKPDAVINDAVTTSSP